MAIIYTYPVKAIPNTNDLILISDSQDSNNTKQVTIGSLPGGSGSGVSSVTSSNVAITVANASTTPVLTSVAYAGAANLGHVPTGGSATTFLRGDGSWIVPTNTTYDIMGSGNSYAAGLVLAGNATHNNNFLRKDGTWAVPLNTTYTGSDGVTLTGTDFTNTNKGSSQFIFKNIAVSGQNTVVADSNDDTLTLAAGSNITLTTNNTTDTVTIASSGGSAGWDVMNLAHGSILSGNANEAYYYQVVSPSTFTPTKVKVKASVAGGSSNFKIAIYRGSLTNLNATALLGQGQISPTASGIYEVTLTEASTNSLNLTAGDNIILGFFHTQGDKLLSNGATPISDTGLAVVVAGIIENFPSTLGSISGSATNLRPCCTIY